MKTVQISFCSWGVKIKANLRIKKEKNNTYYFRINLGYDIKGEKYRNILVVFLLKKRHEKNIQSYCSWI